jgi:hypothetical protein
LALPYKEEKHGNWQNVSELVDFKIIKLAPQSLLGVGKADVMLLYKKKSGETDKDQKKLIIFGPEDEVFSRTIQKINEKKNKRAAAELIKKFNDTWLTTDYEKQASTPSLLLKRKLNELNLNTKEFAKQTGIAAPSLYHHVSGGREISRETAIEYAAKLNCDPVDLMFDKISIPVWSKVNLLKSTELEESYNPGRLFAYADQNNLEKVVVPRDIYREDIKAIKIDARGSMYDNKVAFYYRAADRDADCLNELCIVGVEEPLGPPELTDATEERYYFGLYEEVRGESNLINPDPYVDVYNNKFILKNFRPKFIAPVISLLNPVAVVDKTKLKHNIPQAALVREEEKLKSEIDKLRSELEKRKSLEKTSEEVQKQYEKLEEELKIQLAKVAEVTHRIQHETEQKLSLFQKEQSVMNKIYAPLKIIRGKK